MKDFLSRREGNVAIAAALALVPLIGAGGVALDYSRAHNIRAFLQNQADAAALYGVRASSEADAGSYLAMARNETVLRWGEGMLGSVQFEGNWQGPTDFRVEARAEVPLTLAAILPGVGQTVPVSVFSTARIAEPKLVYKPPVVTDLEPEASDYNRISVYCFDPDMASDPVTRGRTQMTEIADNAGTVYKYEMPQCEAGGAMSYRLLNVRDARTSPHRWDSPHAERYEYFTDTVIEQGVESYDLGGWEILETVLCRNLNECRPQSEGGIIPEGTERNPVRTNQACAPGHYMYYGWEDRPPGLGWTDRDYDDIRVIISCPEYEAVGERVVRLLR